jgi:glycosyltransferase involved in cell wall biosynthesis
VSKTVLIEAHALTLKQGTGIATYARNLANTANEAGYHTELLIGIDRAINRRDPLLAEVGLYDANRPTSLDPVRAVNRALDWAIGVPLGARTQRLPAQRIVLDPTSGTTLARPHPTLAALRMEERAFLHFNRYGRRLSVRTDGTHDLFHATRPIPLSVKQAANVYTIHDLVPLRLPYSTLDNKRYFYRVIKEIIRHADHIVTVSEFTRRDVMEVFDVPESRISNTWQAVSINPAFLSLSDDDVANIVDRRYGLRFKEYFLFLGAIEPKKNVTRMVEAFAASGTPRPLVLVGGLGWQYDADLETINDERFQSWRFHDGQIKAERRVQRLSYVPLASLMALIRGARAVLFPSLYEGFGLPVLEAMLMGTPTITSNTSSLPEVAGDAALLVDPYKTESIRDAITAIDTDADLREELSRRGKERAAFFSPQRYSERVATVYDRLLK